MGAFIDLTGQRFGRLTVIERAEDQVSPCGHSIVMWRCKCECGQEIVVSGNELRRGRNQSCGCLRREATIEKNTTHGLKGCKLYGVWKALKDRCLNSKNKNYKHYGGRGITVCDAWRHDFQAFYDWAMSHGYREDLTIDRIDNDKGYSPENCQWATMKEQRANQRPRQKK